MKQVMNYNKDNGLLNMIRRTDPMINGEKQTELHSQVNERLWCGNTPALSIDRCLLWSYTEVMKKGKMITEPSPGHSYKIKRNSLKDYIKKVIEDDMQKSPNESRYSHAILFFFDSNDNSFKVVAQFYSRKKAYLSSEYYGVAYVNNIPVFICGDTPFILKPLKKKESYKKTQENNYLIIDPLTEIFLYRKATKSFIRIG